MCNCLLLSSAFVSDRRQPSDGGCGTPPRKTVLPQSIREKGGEPQQGAPARVRLDKFLMGSVRYLHRCRRTMIHCLRPENPNSLAHQIRSHRRELAPAVHRSLPALARIHRWTGMDGVRTAEGGEGVTGAMIRARIWVAGRLGGGLQALLGAPMAAYSGCGERDGGIGHGKRRSRTVLARVCGDVGLAGGSVADGRRQAGSGMAAAGGAAELLLPGQRRGRWNGGAAGDPSGQGASSEGLVVTVC